MRSDDLQLLALHDPVTVDELKARYRKLAATLHPDRGGNAEDFAELSAAYERLMVVAEKTAGQCPECRGLGNVDKRFGWSAVKMLCPKCRGSGRA